MLHEPLRAVGRQSTFLHAVQHGGVSCMGVTNPSLALSGHARQFRAETLCSAKRGKGKGVSGPLPHGGWGRVLDFIPTHVFKTTGEPRRITTNKLRCVLSRLACSTADLVSKNGRFWAVFGRFQDDRPENSGHRRYAKLVFPMRTVVLPCRLGYQTMANGCSMRRVPRRGATRWSILR